MKITSHCDDSFLIGFWFSGKSLTLFIGKRTILVRFFN